MVCSFAEIGLIVLYSYRSSRPQVLFKKEVPGSLTDVTEIDFL